VYDFLLVINNNLDPIWQTGTVIEIQQLMAKNRNFFPLPLSFSALVQGDPLYIYNFIRQNTDSTKENTR